MLGEFGYDLNKSFLSKLGIYEVILLFDLLNFIELPGSNFLSFFIEVEPDLGDLRAFYLVRVVVHERSSGEDLVVSLVLGFQTDVGVLVVLGHLATSAPFYEGEDDDE